MKLLKTGIFLFILLQIRVSENLAQISYPGKPSGPALDHNKGVYFIPVERPVKDPSATGDYSVFQTRLSTFADTVPAYYSPHTAGQWDTSGEDIRLWRIGFCSPGASSMGIIFNSFLLHPGTKLFLYSPSDREITGAFTYRNNKPGKILAVAPLKTDSLIIELQVLQKTKDFGELEVRQIGLGFVHSKEKSTADEWYGHSAECHTDINCYPDRQLHLEKHAVCRIIFGNSGRCTGTLINNTANDSRPMVLTSAHCIKTEALAATAIFFFDYESPYCNGTDGHGKSLSGSRLLARSEDLDFSLIELTDKIPVDFNPVYAGWNATSNAFSKTYTIHHPEGDVKKIAVNTEPVTDGSEAGMEKNAFWMVPTYEMGSTEGGSSGSALFDSTFHIRGILSFGGSVCEPYIYDYYAKFGRSWNYFTDSSSQLAHWLDPLKMNIPVSGRHVPGDPFQEYSEQLSNITADDSLIMEQQKSGWGYPTGLNSDGINEYAEHFYRNGSKYIYALKVDVAKAHTQSNKSKVIFKLWDGEDIPRKLIYEQSVLLFEFMPEETHFIRLDTIQYVDQDFFIGYEIVSAAFTDTFSVFYSSPLIKQTENSAFANVKGVWRPISDGSDNISTSLALFPLVFNYYVDYKSVPGDFPEFEIILYPNPARDYLQILFKEKPEATLSCSIVDLCGREISVFEYDGREPNFSVNIGSLQEGMYIVYVHYPKGVFKTKFVKLK